MAFIEHCAREPIVTHVSPGRGSFFLLQLSKIFIQWLLVNLLLRCWGRGSKAELNG